jgi:hypothetical protein
MVLLGDTVFSGEFENMKLEQTVDCITLGICTVLFSEYIVSKISTSSKFDKIWWGQ